MNIIQWILILFGVAVLVLAVIYRKQDNTIPMKHLMLAATIAIIGALNPADIARLVFKLPGGGELSVERYIPSAEEREATIAQFIEPNLQRINNPLVEAATNRPDEQRAATDYLTLALKALEEEQFAESFLMAYKGLASTPKDDTRMLGSFMNLLGFMFASVGASQLAATYIQQAIDLLPNSPTLHNTLGTLFEKVGRPVDAERAYRDAIGHDPVYSHAYLNLGSLLESQEKYLEADSALSTAIRLDPKFYLAYSNYGVLLAKMGKIEDAERAFNTAIELNPAYPQSYINMGYLMESTGRPNRAKDYYTIAEQVTNANAQLEFEN